MSNFTITPSSIPDVKIIQPRTYEDDRGFFLETYSQPALLQGGIDIAFVQDNHSLSTQTGTLRGLHFQRPPFAQDKLVRVVRGRIWDVAVDMRRSSPTFAKWFGLELSASNRTQLLVPIGFAHGFLTLSLLSHFHSQAVQLAFPMRMGINYGLNRVRFVSPVPAGSRIRLRIALLRLEPFEGGEQATWSVTVEREGAEKPACVVEWLVRYYL